jgi:hypothetical protein
MRTIEPICGLSVSDGLHSCRGSIWEGLIRRFIFERGPALWAIWVSILLIFSVNHRYSRMTSLFSNCLHDFVQESQGDVWMWFMWWLVMYSLKLALNFCFLVALCVGLPPPPPHFYFLSSSRRIHTKQKWRTFYWSFELKKKTRRSRSRSRSRR